MLKRFLLLLLCLNLLPFYLLAQTQTVAKKKQIGLPTLVLEGGLMAGATGPSADWRGGLFVPLKKGHLGTLLGYDFYTFKSIPWVAQARLRTFRIKSKPFVLASAGINLPINRKGSGSDAIPVWGGSFVRWEPHRTYKTGFYGEWGGGVFLLSKKRFGLYSTFTHSIKTTNESFESQVYNPGTGMSESSTNSSIHKMQRLHLRVGIQWK